MTKPKLIGSILGVIGSGILVASVAFASVTLEYYNEDSVDRTYDATCSGSKYKVTFSHSTTSATTIQGSLPCTIHTPSGDFKVEGPMKVRIKDNKISKN